MTLPKRLDALVGFQLGRWEAASRPSTTHPCVAIASLPGAGGEEVGRLVAEQLGYGLFGREIVDEIARRRNVSQELMSGLDERLRTVIDRYVADFVRERRFNETDYLHEVARAVTTLGGRGMAVVVGRGAAFLLPPEKALRVLVCAPREMRVERWAKRTGDDRARADASLREEDARRIEFIRHHFGADLTDPIAYDLVVNTASLGVAVAADTVASVLRRRFAIEPAS
jgi:cytidylate kinase